MLGGGIAGGEVTELVGASCAGKSQLCMSMAVNTAAIAVVVAEEEKSLESDRAARVFGDVPAVAGAVSEWGGAAGPMGANTPRFGDVVYLSSGGDCVAERCVWVHACAWIRASPFLSVYTSVQ